MKKMLVFALVLAVCSPVMAGSNFSAGAIGNAIVQPGGNRDADYALNIEGANNGSFASYGVVRFDSAGLLNVIEAAFPGGYEIQSISLEVTQWNAGFTTNGQVDLYFTEDDTTSLAPGVNSGQTYPWSATDFAPHQMLSSYNFVEVASGHTESHVLYDINSPDAASTALLNDFLNDSLLSVALVDADANVAATYAGYTNFNYDGPALVVNAIVPEPATLGLLACGFLAVIRKR